MSLDSKKSKRIFISVPAPIGTDILDEGKSLKIVSTNKRHITILFLGSVTAEQYEFVLRSFMILPLPQSFSIKIGSLMILPTRQNPKSLVLKVIDRQDCLACLKNKIDEVIGGRFKSESRIFLPHVTIARISKYYNRVDLRRIIKKYPKETKLEFTIKKIQLLQSIVSDKGSEYKILAEKKLR